jgi:thiol-disulfide isomerase/thioredoxin
MSFLSRRRFSAAALGLAAGSAWPAWAAATDLLADQGPAPEFTGLGQWFNSDPLTMQGLSGKVVLVDFWTYTCINCLNTLPHVLGWHARYKDQGLVVVGVHTPEFAFEKLSGNVASAVQRLGIHYPVAQDNAYATWKAYDNQYWPAFYLVDRSGRVRREHFGEGAYDEMDRAIQALLAQPPRG